MKKLFPFFILIVFSNLCLVQFTSEVAYVGNWTEPGSWVGEIPPLIGITSDIIIIASDGEITANSAVEFSVGILDVNGALAIEVDSIQS